MNSLESWNSLERSHILTTNFTKPPVAGRLSNKDNLNKEVKMVPVPNYVLEKKTSRLEQAGELLLSKRRWECMKY